MIEFAFLERILIGQWFSEQIDFFFLFCIVRIENRSIIFIIWRTYYLVDILTYRWDWPARYGSVCGLNMRNCERFYFFGAQYLTYDCLVSIGIYIMNNAIKINLYRIALTLYVHGCRKIAQKLKYQIEINNLSIIWCESNGIGIGNRHFRCAALLSSKKARMIYHFVINL